MLKNSKQFICLNAIVFRQSIILNPIGFIEIIPNPNLARIIVAKGTINTRTENVNLPSKAGVLIRENCTRGIVKKRNKHFTWRTIKTDRTNSQLQRNINQRKRTRVEGKPLDYGKVKTVADRVIVAQERLIIS